LYLTKIDIYFLQKKIVETIHNLRIVTMETLLKMMCHEENKERITSVLVSLLENKLHCPGCAKHSLDGYQFRVRFLEETPARTKEEEHELILFREMASFFTFIYDEVCKRAAAKLPVHRPVLATPMPTPMPDPSPKKVEGPSPIKIDYYC
jgi:hypothetical protein